MWLQIKQKILQLRTATGVEVVFGTNETPIFHTYTLTLNKNILVKKSKVSNIKSFPELKTISRNIPAAVSFSGKGVLIKKVQGQVEEEGALALVLPQANPSEFYIKVTHLDSYSVVAVARKSLINQSISQIEDQGIQVLHLSLGINYLENLIPYFKEQTVETICYTIHIRNNSLSDIETKDFQKTFAELNEYLVGQQYLQSFDIMAYAAAAHLLAHDLESMPDIPNEKVQANREEFRYGSLFKAAAFSTLAFVFIVLLINFFVYNYYFIANKKFAEQYQFTQAELASQSEKKQSLEKKEQFLQQAGWLQKSKTSFFADRFASFLPEGIWLTGLQFYPKKNQFSDSESIQLFKKDTIELSGMCNDPYQINLLINNIKTMKEIAQVNMTDYSFKKEEETGNFLLEIVTR